VRELRAGTHRLPDRRAAGEMLGVGPERPIKRRGDRRGVGPRRGERREHREAELPVVMLDVRVETHRRLVGRRSLCCPHQAHGRGRGSLRRLGEHGRDPGQRRVAEPSESRGCRAHRGWDL
jgi:hypothetical protein